MFQKIEPQKSITELRAFSDEKGAVGTDTPPTLCTTVFSETNGKTLVTVTAKYRSPEIFEFMAHDHKEGLASCYEKLDKTLATIKKQRK
ncbi:SRPBCC domain-containing protein [Flavitalea sp.]